MPVCVGIDLVCVDEVRESVRIHGERYLQRVYTQEELRDCRGSAARLAERFAAKEAAIKAMGPHDDPVPWRSVSVKMDRGGRPSLVLSGAAKALARQRALGELSVSFSQHHGRAAAAVVLATLDRRP